jgi:hypothetical protein
MAIDRAAVKRGQLDSNMRSNNEEGRLDTVENGRNDEPATMLK